MRPLCRIFRFVSHLMLLVFSLILCCWLIYSCAKVDGNKGYSNFMSLVWFVAVVVVFFFHMVLVLAVRASWSVFVTAGNWFHFVCSHLFVASKCAFNFVCFNFHSSFVCSVLTSIWALSRDGRAGGPLFAIHFMNERIWYTKTHKSVCFFLYFKFRFRIFIFPLCLLGDSSKA